MGVCGGPHCWGRSRMTRREPDPEGGGLVGREARPRQQANLPASRWLLQLLVLLLLERL